MRAKRTRFFAVSSLSREDHYLAVFETSQLRDRWVSEKREKRRKVTLLVAYTYGRLAARLVRDRGRWSCKAWEPVCQPRMEV